MVVVWFVCVCVVWVLVLELMCECSCECVVVSPGCPPPRWVLIVCCFELGGVVWCLDGLFNTMVCFFRVCG